MLLKRFKLSLFIGAAMVLTGCGLTGMLPSDTHVKVYYDEAVNTSESKVIVFPVLLHQAGFADVNDKFDSVALDAIFVKDWTDRIGTDNLYVLPKKLIKEAPNGWEATEKLVTVMNKASNPGKLSDELLTKFLSSLTSKVGDGAIALAVIQENETQYDSSDTIHLDMALFDTKSLSYKWVTKTTEVQKIGAVPYQVAVKSTSDKSWDKLVTESNRPIR